MTPALPNTLILKSGSHDPGTDMCVMEAVAYLAGEPWTDSPECASPVIAAFLRSWNDGIPDDATRTRLLTPFIPRLVGSKSSSEVEGARAWLAVDWSVRVSTPAWLDLAGLTTHAEALRGLTDVTASTIREAQPIINAAWDAAAAAAWDAVAAVAWDAARTAAEAVAWDAAAAAAWDAVAAVAWDAARTAAEAVAWDASRAAAWDAAATVAWDAAEAVARDALAPTVTTLQESAVNLIDRMLEVKA